MYWAMPDVHDVVQIAEHQKAPHQRALPRAMPILKGFWMEKNRWLKRWFISARKLHDIHHRVLNDSGLMDKNFGIGFFVFDRVFGTLSPKQVPFNHRGYAAARERFRYVETPQGG
jgi:sterol desaturase/sphingolipid hydroxylase (fatty acid hydroxylase superfamily)